MPAFAGMTILDRNIHMLPQARGLSRLWGLGRSCRCGQRSLLERQGRKTFGLCQCRREAWLLCGLRHGQPGARLAGGLLGGNQGGTDLHKRNPSNGDRSAQDCATIP